MASVPLLRMTDISKHFGATRALDGVSLEVRPGEVLALLGENGAGKSTLLHLLGGAQSPDSGEMELDGDPYRPRSPAAARRAGVAMIYQELNLAPHLSVEDNIMLGQEVSHGGWLRRGQQRPRVQRALELLGHPDLRPDTPVQQLSVAAQQLVEIARALVMEARVIVFDEPTSSLTRKDVERLFEVIRRLRARGIGVVYISHFLEEVRQICDTYSVLRDGRSVGAGTLSGATESQIVSLMVGRSVEELFPQIPHTPGAVLLNVEQLSGSRVPQELSLQVRAGEILGITGLVGAGRTEFLRCLFGLDPIRSGEVTLAEIGLRSSPRRAIDAGLGFVSEDRKGEGLAQQQSIVDNLTLSHLKPYSQWGFLNLFQRQAAAREWMRTLQVKARDPNQQISELSGGNQQKVALARILHQQAQVLLLDEPTRGIDVGTKAEIYRLMGEAAARGKAILFVSSYFTDLLAVCDRIAVMSRGRLQRIRVARDWTEHSILQAAMSLEDHSS